MNSQKIRQMDKAVYIGLVILAAVAALVSMVTGPLGYDEISIGAAFGACLIAVAILWRTICAFRLADKE